MSRDNYAYFIAADCNLFSPIGRLLTELGFVNELMLREQIPRKGSVIVSQCGKIKLFGLVCRDHSFDQLTEDDVYWAIHRLKSAMIETNSTTVRISRIDGTGESIPEQALRNILRRVFSRSDLSVTLCLEKIETPSPDKSVVIIEENHSSLAGGYKGLRKAYRQIRERFYWPDMVRQIQNWIKTCRSC